MRRSANLNYVFSLKVSTKKLLPGYFVGLSSKEARDRYSKKFGYMNETDPYEIPRSEWKDQVNKWPSVT